jgi:CRP-like cAMP-binding protein
MTYADANHRAAPMSARSWTVDKLCHGARPMTPIGAFGYLPDEDVQSLMQWSNVRPLKRREVMVRQGDPGGTVMLVLEGYLKSFRTLADGREVVLDIIGPGECFGEMTAINRSAHDADVSALTRCRVLSIDGRKYRQVLERRPESLLEILRAVGERLERATENLVDARGRTAPIRLARILLQLARVQSLGERNPAGIQLRLSQGELGSMTGLTRESVNKILGIWRDEGWLQLTAGVVTMIDCEALSRLISDESENGFDDGF